ncbi:MAG: hypothetical protein WDO70_12465 [Alphaproteobacteria bacterium]
MNKTIARCVMIVAVGLWIAIAIFSPHLLGDSNTFLKGFVNQEFIGLLGVVVTITLASAANLHLELNKLEEKVNKAIFRNTRTSVRLSAYTMIWTMFFGLVLVVIKPLICGGDNESVSALINGGALLIVLSNIIILADLTQAIFKIEPSFK